jgi:hypothetical protein
VTCDEPIDEWREPHHDACRSHVLPLLSLSTLYVERELTFSALPTAEMRPASLR